MRDSVLATPRVRMLVAADALDAAVRSWFLVTVVGQGFFLYYVLAFYGPSALAGEFETWNRHPMAGRLFVAGDLAGNVAFGAHVALAAIVLLGGTLQLIPPVRARAPALHRWNGRAFMAAAMLAALAGLYLVWIRGGSSGGLPNAIIISGNAALVLAFGGLAWRAIRIRDFTAHRRWALRMFMVSNGVFFLRLALCTTMMLTRAQPSRMTFHALGALSYLLPLAVLEIYLCARSGSAKRRQVAAALIFACSLYMAVGTVGFRAVFIGRILAAL